MSGSPVHWGLEHVLNSHVNLTFSEVNVGINRSPRNLRIACDHRGLTHFGGVYFFHEFLQVLQVRRFLTQNLDYPRRNQRYSLAQMILALVYPLVSAGPGSPRNRVIPTFQRYLSIFDCSAKLPRSADAATLSAPGS